MNTFGIPAAIATAMMIYERASRGSGRTMSLLKAMDDGDVLLVGGSTGHRMADWCRRNLHRMGKVDWRVLGVDHMDDLRGGYAHEAIRKQMASRDGVKVWMDHTLIFQLHEQAMLGVQNDLHGFLRSIGQADLKDALLGQMTRPGDVPPVVGFIRGGDFRL